MFKWQKSLAWFRTENQTFPAHDELRKQKNPNRNSFSERVLRSLSRCVDIYRRWIWLANFVWLYKWIHKPKMGKIFVLRLWFDGQNSISTATSFCHCVTSKIILFLFYAIFLHDFEIFVQFFFSCETRSAGQRKTEYVYDRRWHVLRVFLILILKCHVLTIFVTKRTKANYDSGLKEAVYFGVIVCVCMYVSVVSFNCSTLIAVGILSHCATDNRYRYR